MRFLPTVGTVAFISPELVLWLFSLGRIQPASSPTLPVPMEYLPLVAFPLGDVTKLRAIFVPFPSLKDQWTVRNEVPTSILVMN
jgi:hypothetical protein